jgi:hypothetical protein
MEDWFTRKIGFAGEEGNAEFAGDHAHKRPKIGLILAEEMPN